MSATFTCMVLLCVCIMQDVRFGNNVSHSERKTRRRWNPNVQRKRLWSEILNEFVYFQLTTQTLKQVDKAGGLDNFLLSRSDKKLSSSQGSQARARILEALEEANASNGN